MKSVSTTILILISLFFMNCLSLRIDCEYFADTFAISECATTNVKVLERNEPVTVTSISGTLLSVVDYAKIKSFRIEQSPHLEYFPSELEKFFPNLEKIVISQTGLKSLDRDDLERFPALKTLQVNDNRLRHLNSDVFQFNGNIENLDLSGNKLEHFGAGIWKALPKLEHLDVSNNVCINQSAIGQIEMKKLKLNLRQNCSSSKSVGNLAFFSFVLICFLAILSTCLLVFVIKLIVKQ